MIHLNGWTKELPQYIEDAVKSGILKVISVKDKKYGSYEILQGEIKVENTIISFK